MEVGVSAILGAATATNVKKENKKRKILANAVAMLLQALWDPLKLEFLILGALYHILVLKKY